MIKDSERGRALSLFAKECVDDDDGGGGGGGGDADDGRPIISREQTDLTSARAPPNQAHGTVQQTMQEKQPTLSNPVPPSRSLGLQW